MRRRACCLSEEWQHATLNYALTNIATITDTAAVAPTFGA